MRAIFFVSFLMIVSLSFAQTKPNENLDSLFFPKLYANVGHPFPKFSVIEGRKVVDNNSLQGKVVFINFWFEGCHPCMAEMEALNELQEKLKSNKDFMFISFTWDNKKAIQRVKEKYGLSFTVLSVSRDECDRLNFGGSYPTNIVLDKTGTIKYLHTGGSTKKEEAREFVRSTLLSKINELL